MFIYAYIPPLLNKGIRWDVHAVRGLCSSFFYALVSVDKSKCVKTVMVVGQNIIIFVITMVLYRYDLLSNKLAHKLILVKHIWKDTKRLSVIHDLA